MKRLLLTGGSGFIGRNIIPLLSQSYDIYAPGRYELDIKDTDAVRRTFETNAFDVVILAGIPTQVNNKTSLDEDVLRSIVLSFLNFYQMRKKVKKIIYFGSGAEFNKQIDITSVREEELGGHLPQDPYGLAKFLINQLASFSDNIYNLRLFGCFGPTDAERKFISHCIACCLNNMPITIRQNCIFNYLYVEDLFPALQYCIENTPLFHDYNMCSDINYSLVDIASIVKEKMNSSNEIIVSNPLWGKAYSGSNKRIKEELPSFALTTLERGIELQIEATVKAKKLGEL